MALIENRFFWYPEQKDSSAFRIVCLGDSMIFGIGVTYEETLPMQLEKNLNRVIWEPFCEVINAGISGFSLYDDWHFYMSDINRYNPDLIIITLCENDIELFTAQGDYRKHIEECWDEQKPYIRYFRAFFNQIGNYTSASKIPCIITFYDISGDLEKSRYASIIQKNCEENGLDFINLAEEFTGEYSGSKYKALNASSVDPHPSAIAHQIAVQKISRHLIRRGKIPQVAQNTEEKIVLKKIIEFGDNLFSFGLPPEACLYRIQEIIDSKKSGKARAGLDKELLIDESEYTDLTEKISNEMDLCARLLYMEGVAGRFINRSRDQFGKLNMLNKLVLESYKEMFILERNLNDSSLTYSPFSANVNDNGVDLNSYIYRLNAITEWLKTFEQYFLTDIAFDFNESVLLNIHNNIIVRYCNAASSLDPYFKEIIGYSHSIRNLLDCFIMIFKSSEKCHSDSTFTGLLLGILKKFGTILDYLESSIKIFPADKQGAINSSAKYKPFTECSITIKSACKALGNVIIITECLVPYRSLLQDTQYIINDNASHVYVFKLPVITYGTFTINLTTIDQTRIEMIQIHNNPYKPVIFNQIPNQNTITLKDILIPV